MIHPNNFSRDPRGQFGFTLIELLITISIIGMMAMMVLFAFSSAEQVAKEHKTKVIIAKLDSVIKAKMESYRTRRVPINIQDEFIDSNKNGVHDSGETSFGDLNGNGTLEVFSIPTRNKIRLDVLRDLMRMEMPDRWTDIADGPAAPIGWVNNTVQRPSVSQGFLRRYNNNPPMGQYQGAECLYLVVSNLALTDSEIDLDGLPKGDIDGNGWPEFQDAWGTPIRWLRWAPGFQSELQTTLTITNGSATVTGQTATITAVGTFSSLATAYVGGTIAGFDPISGAIKPTQTARITGYAYTGSQATFTCKTPPYTMQVPFGTNPPTSVNTFVVMGPDPFDATAVYPLYNPGSASAPSPADTSVPTFALYPLIYSAGPNKCYGVSSDFTQPKLEYAIAAVALNPFYCQAGGVLVGTQQDLPKEPNFVSRGWLDNIHNQMMTGR